MSRKLTANIVSELVCRPRVGVGGGTVKELRSPGDSNGGKIFYSVGLERLSSAASTEIFPLSDFSVASRNL